MEIKDCMDPTLQISRESTGILERKPGLGGRDFGFMATLQA